MLKSVKRLMMIKGPKTYQEILLDISNDVDWNFNVYPDQSTINELQKYLTNGIVEDSKVPTFLSKRVTDIESKSDTFETEFDASSIKANTLHIEMCEANDRNMVFVKLTEKLMESKALLDAAMENLKEVYQNLQKTDANKSLGDALKNFTESMITYHEKKTPENYLMEYY
ncbi:hypothetical protein MHBO_004558 [Bonamia ostreae]|uniref:Uncharacterized protein n=1 Tax=Bonamia ostreae TaxID=126728 RepID=A0ABV2AU80_9EUKA